MSYSGRPAVIHSAITLPTPPAPASPCTQNPAAVHSPRTSVSPRMKSPSGVNASGAFTTFAGSSDRSAGTRLRAPSHDSAKRSMSGSNVVRGCASGASVSQVTGSREYPPTSSPPESCGRKYMMWSGSLTVGMSETETASSGSVTTYWWRIGVIGMTAPAIAPTTPVAAPAAITTDSAAIAPWSVCTPVTRPPSTSMPVTATRSCSATPRRRAPSASACASSSGSTYPSPGIHADPVRSSTFSRPSRSRVSAGDSRSSSSP